MVTMPTNAEISKELSNLRSYIESELAKNASEIKNEMNKCTNACTAALKQEVEEMKKSMAFMNATFEELKTKSEVLVHNNEVLKKENDVLRTQVTSLSNSVTQLEQYSRLNNVEVRGVPITKSEDCRAIIKAVGEKVSCPVTEADIDTCHRVPVARSTDAKNIIVRFTSRDKKNDFLRKARKARLSVEDLGFRSQGTGSVFFNDHLSPQNKRLFASALQLKKEKSWRFLWTDQCMIKARKLEDSQVYKITCEDDLRVFQ